ncbi:MAG: hypothetical protein KIS77_11170 [Saprospiraceae bacterium]|nr:hypothetical protein [Saprospiraceae bacterium]
MKKIITMLSILSFFGCVGNRLTSGMYISTCRINDLTAVKLQINKDSTFQYFLAYNDELVIGKWKVIKDTLFLTSSKFEERRESLRPVIKNTDQPLKDMYLIKEKKLKIINTHGVTNDCYLKRSK